MSLPHYIPIIFPLLSAIFVFALGIFVFYKNKNALVNRTFFFHAISITIWLSGSVMLFLSRENVERAIFWDRFVYIGVVFIPIFMHHFSLAFTKNKGQKKLLYLGYILSFIFLALSRTNFFVSDLYVYKWSVHTKARFFHHVFLLFFFFYIFLLFRNLLYYYKSINYHIERLRTKYVFLAFFLLVSIGSTAYLPAYGIGLYPFAYISGVIFTAILAYAILRYRLMDIRIVIKRSAIFTFLVLVITALYVFVVTYLSETFKELVGTQSEILTGAFIGVIVALGFQPLKKLLQTATDRFLFKGEYNFEELLSELSEILSTTLHLDALLEKVTQKMVDSLRIKKMAIILYRENSTCEVAQNKGFDFHQANIRLPALLKYFKSDKGNSELIIFEEIKNLYTNSPQEHPELVRPLAEMEKYDIALTTPLFTKDKLVGFFLLGGKKSGDVFSAKDIKLLDIVSSQAATAIVNASLYEQAQEKLKELSALYQLTKTLVGTLEMNRILNAIMDAIIKVGKVDRALMYLLDPTGKYLIATVGRGDDPKLYEGLKLELAKSSLRKVIETRKPLVVENIYKNPDVNIEYAEAVKTEGFAAVPLAVEDKVFGVIGVDTKTTKRPIKSIDIHLLNTLANQAAIAISNARLFEEQQTFTKKLKEEVKKATRDLRIANKELQKLDRAKSEFISIASHQLRTPLTIIKGYVSMMLEGSFGTLNEQQVDSLQKVYLSNERLIQLVEDLLSISRIESGRMEFTMQPLDLKTLVEEVVEELRPNAQKKNLYLHFEPQKEPLPLIKADKKKIHESISNIVDNAIKYTQKGGITVRITKKRNRIITSIADTGIGIPKEEKRVLFQKFSRGKGMSLIHTEGTGLGLFVCRKLIEAHGGKVWVESKGKGHGSTFFVSLQIDNKSKTQEKKIADKDKSALLEKGDKETQDKTIKKTEEVAEKTKKAKKKKSENIKKKEKK